MNIFDVIFKHNTKSEFVPLQKKGDMDQELNFQLQSIQETGSKVIDIIHRDTKTIILYRRFFEDIPPEETDITLELRIITKKGIVHPTPKLFALYSDDFKKISLADIKILDSMANEGYGSILLRCLIKIAEEEDIHSIRGWISPVDENHIERLVHFYKKHNFIVSLNHDHHSFKIGDLKWTNDSI